MRRIEITRIKKRDIKFRKRYIIVRTAKNHRQRIVHIDLKLAIILFFYCRNLEDDELLFEISSATVSIYFHNIMKKSNLKKITFHDIRHLHAAFLLAKLKNKANSLIAVQCQLGHSTPVETLQTYSHVRTTDIRYAIRYFSFI